MTSEETYEMTLSALRALPVEELPAACARVRRFALSQTREKAGHLAASLGVAELTVALHYVLNTPEDVLLWDVGHQAYLHKIITDRAGTFATQRKPGGLSGFPKREESPFDAFGVGHSSTALSAAVGFWRADAATGRRRQRVAVVGDGALTGGMSFEALNDGGGAGADVLLILNDNGLSIEPTVGALARGGAARMLVLPALAWALASIYPWRAASPEVLAAGESARVYLGQVESVVRAASPGSAVRAPGLPLEQRDPRPWLDGRERTFAVLAPYSVAAFVELAFPARAVRVVPPAAPSLPTADEVVLVLER